MVELIPPLCGDFEAYLGYTAVRWLTAPMLDILITYPLITPHFHLLVFPDIWDMRNLGFSAHSIHLAPRDSLYSASVRRWMPGSAPAAPHPEKKAVHQKEMPGRSQSAEARLAAFCRAPPCCYQARHQRGRFCRSSGAKGVWPSAEWLILSLEQEDLHLCPAHTLTGLHAT